MLWATDSERLAVVNRVHNVQPFAKSYDSFGSNFYQGMGAVADEDLSNTRGGWTDGPNLAEHALANALVVAIEGPANAPAEAILCKKRLLRVARLQPVRGVGFCCVLVLPSPKSHCQVVIWPEDWLLKVTVRGDVPLLESTGWATMSIPVAVLR